MAGDEAPEVRRIARDHETRLRALEAYREHHEGRAAAMERSMTDTLQRIEKHLSDQDEKIDHVTQKLSRWGGGLAVILGAAGIVVVVVEIAKAFTAK